MIEVTCNRCGGTGKYSFNPKDGDMCYGCQGKGFKLMTEAAYNRQQALEQVKAAKAEAAKEYEKRVTTKLNGLITFLEKLGYTVDEIVLQNKAKESLNGRTWSEVVKEVREQMSKPA